VNRPLFSVAGIPVTIDVWFLLTLLLFYSLSGGGRAGIYAAAGIGVFTLIHELGHAFAARRFGATVEIRLTFLMGWAAYSADSPLKRWQSNVISAAGPLTHLASAAIALAAVRLLVDPNPQSLELAFDLYVAISWAGVVLAVLNLLPLLPLDGGHIAESFIGPAQRRAFLQATVAVCGLALAFGLLGGRNSGIAAWATDQRQIAFWAPLPEAIFRLVISVPAIFISSGVFIPLFCGFSAYQLLRQQDTGTAWKVTMPTTGASDAPEVISAVLSAERSGWATSNPGGYPKGWGASPWLNAEVIRRLGGSAEQVGAALSHLDSQRPRWMVDQLDRPEIAMLLAAVPPAAATSPAVAQARVLHGDARTLVDTALAAFHHDPGATGFYLIADGLAARGDLDGAMQWLTAAVERAPDPQRVATSPHLRVLHGRRDYQQLLGVAQRAVSEPG